MFETAIEQIEQKLGLEDQPRAIVFHEKEGRRHAHAVWSRIEKDEMKAINLPFYKMKLKDVSRELYLEHGWKIPPGLIDRKDRNPLNFSREEWQQARRAGLHAKDTKRTFQESWAISDSRTMPLLKPCSARGLFLLALIGAALLRSITVAKPMLSPDMQA